MSIFFLAKYRKPKEKNIEYYCRQCDAMFFRLKADGSVSCGHCGALMKNLKVSYESSGHIS